MLDQRKLEDSRARFDGDPCPLEVPLLLLRHREVLRLMYLDRKRLVESIEFCHDILAASNLLQKAARENDQEGVDKLSETLQYLMDGMTDFDWKVVALFFDR